MPTVLKSVLVNHSAEAMYDLVDHIEAYPRFLPWCAGTRVLQRTDSAVLARIDIDYHGVRAHFTTANRNRRPEQIVVELRDGPFQRLDGEWIFHALSPTASKIEFKLTYEFATTMLATVIAPVFAHIADTFIDAFVRRADQMHGTAR